MRWSLVVAGRPPSDLELIRSAARAAAIIPIESLGPGEVLADGVVVVGADPDLAAVADRIAPATGPLALVPSAPSDLLRMFGLTRSEMIERLQSGAPYRVDLGVLTHRGARLPFAAHAVASTPGPPWLARSRTIVVQTPDRERRIEAWRVVAANAQHVGANTLAPRAALTDGRLDLQAFGGSLLQRTSLQRRLRRGLHLGHRAVWRRSLESAVIELPPRWSISIDGMTIGRGVFRVSVRPGAYDLWI